MKAKEEVKMLDIRGDICPITLIKTVKEIKKMKPGEKLLVLSDHPPAKKTIPMEMDEKGHRYEMNDKGAEFEIEIVVS